MATKADTETETSLEEILSTDLPRLEESLSKSTRTEQSETTPTSPAKKRKRALHEPKDPITETETILDGILSTDLPRLEESLSKSTKTEQPETTPTSSAKKRKRASHEPKDPNAPKRPVTAYLFFNAETRPKVKKEQPELTMSERAKVIGSMWGSLEKEKKQRYVEMAQKDKDRYIQEYMAYQETESYKQFMRKKFPGLSKNKKSKKESPKKSQRAKPEDKASEKKEKTTPARPSSAKTPLSCKQQFVPGSNIPIFSDEFLQHNREMESQLRKLRQSTSNMEEENALLSRHVENMKSAVVKVQEEVKRQQERNSMLQDHLTTLRSVLASTFKDIALPDTNETPTPETVDSYMNKLQVAISNEPEKHPDLVEKVSDIAKGLETILTQKLSQDILAADQSVNKPATTDATKVQENGT